jgi:hypothetical protein
MPRDARTSPETIQGNQQLQMLSYAREKAMEIIEEHETLAIPPAIDIEIRKRYSILC